MNDGESGSRINLLNNWTEESCSGLLRSDIILYSAVFRVHLYKGSMRPITPQPRAPRSATATVCIFR